ncbi:MAG: PDZ domain-containing protein [Clostridia bacterium]|nr:PDZ domain-containing protein [Clostridia bacterium]
MKIKCFSRLFAVLMILALAASLLVTGASAAGLPVLKGEIDARLPDLLSDLAPASGAANKLNVGGYAFGVRLFSEGVQVVGLADPASPGVLAGLERNDRILSLNGKAVSQVDDVVRAIEESGGKPLTLEVQRGSERLTLTLTPRQDATGKWRAGIWVRDNAAGIGTVTFVDPKTGAFGGLGHGICDADTGELVPLTRGAVMETEINGVVKGTEGTPGELKGYLGTKKIGSLLLNCDKGVFGVLSPVPDGLGDPVEVGGRSTVHAGEAILRCTLDGKGPKDYKIELGDIRADKSGTKCFSVHVTDPALLDKTGGIVQGMSGSPILQDGRLVGAVTHVLVGDPTRGYGIFLDNMLASLPRELT